MELDRYSLARYGQCSTVVTEYELKCGFQGVLCHSFVVVIRIMQICNDKSDCIDPAKAHEAPNLASLMPWEWIEVSVVSNWETVSHPLSL